MRHSNKNRVLGRTRKGRTALLRTLAVSLIENGKIKTTEAKAKELRPYVERLITYGKDGSVAARRKAARCADLGYRVLQRVDSRCRD